MTRAVDTSAEAVALARETLLGWLTGPDSGQNDGLVEASNLLAALAAERDATWRIYEEAQRHADHWAQQTASMTSERDALAAEVARLREALQKVVDAAEDGDEMTAIELAEAALATNAKDPEP